MSNAYLMQKRERIKHIGRMAAYQQIDILCG